MSKDGLNIYYQMDLHDNKTGKLIKKGRKKVCHSFVRQFIDILEAIMRNDSSVTALATNNTSNAVTSDYTTSASTMLVNAGVNIDTYGLVVGAGTNTTNVTDYKLQTQLMHGTSANQLQYGAVSFGTPTADTTKSYFTIARVFTNATGTTSTVNEIGIYCSTINKLNCIARDKLGSTTSIPNGQALTLTYTVQATA